MASYRLNQLRLAIRHYEMCTELGGDQQMAEFNIGLALFDLGTELFESGERRESLRFLHRARKIMRGPQPGYASAEKVAQSLEIIDLYLGGDEKEEAVKFPTILEQLDDAQLSCDNRGYTASIRKLRSVLDRLQPSQRSEKARAIAGLAIAHLKGDVNIELAFSECEAARELCKATNDLDCQAYVRWCHALVHFRAGDISKALRLNHESMELAQQADSAKMIRACLRAIANCYRGKGDDETAIEYEMQASRIPDP